jgi:glycosyltransferase involved in cell wall biosynthesis
MNNEKNTMVSVIMPYVNEWPQIVFAVRSVMEELDGYVDFEIILIDNYCKEVQQQKYMPDRGHDRYILNHGKECIGLYDVAVDLDRMKLVKSHLYEVSKLQKVVKYVRYEEKLSHWNAKNQGVLNSRGNILLFLDAHVVPSKGVLRRAVKCFIEMGAVREDDTLHLQLSYNILEKSKLIYRLVHKPEDGVVHYRFLQTYPKLVDLTEVPCMSTCGMFMWKSLYNKIGGWPTGLGIYGGGENYINFVLAILGSRKYIFPFGTLHHHGDKRDYSFNWEDYHRNRMIATACFGGAGMVYKYEQALGGNAITQRLASEAIESSAAHSKGILSQQKMSIDDWCKNWEGLLMSSPKLGRVTA